MQRIKAFIKRWWVGLALLLISPLLWGYVQAGSTMVTFPNSNFFTLWLGGHLQASGGNPYSSKDWLDASALFDATWVPNPIFVYPLPLAYLLIPLGWLALSQAYSVWAFLTLLATMASLFLLVDQWDQARHKVFVLPMAVALFLFAPVLEAPGKGTLGGVQLLAMVLAIYLFNGQKWMAGGMLSAFLLVKPTFGLPALILLGAWMLSRRKWHGIVGMVIGSLFLYVLGAISNPRWPIQFLTLGQHKVEVNLGTQPTLLHAAGFFCQRNPQCSYGLGMAASLLLAGLIALFIFKRRPLLEPVEAMSLAMIASLLITPYLWSYDYVLLVIPLSWLVYQLILRTKSYWVPILFLILLDVAAGAGLYLQSLSPQKDLWNILLPLTLLVMLMWMLLHPLGRPSEKQNSQPSPV